MSRERFEDLLDDWARGRLGDREQEEFERLLADQADLREEAEDHRTILRMLASAPEVKAPEGLLRSALAKARAEPGEGGAAVLDIGEEIEGREGSKRFPVWMAAAAVLVVMIGGYAAFEAMQKPVTKPQSAEQAVREALPAAGPEQSEVYRADRGTVSRGEIARLTSPMDSDRELEKTPEGALTDSEQSVVPELAAPSRQAAEGLESSRESIWFDSEEKGTAPLDAARAAGVPESPAGGLGASGGNLEKATPSDSSAAIALEEVPSAPQPAAKPAGSQAGDAMEPPTSGLAMDKADGSASVSAEVETGERLEEDGRWDFLVSGPEDLAANEPSPVTGKEEAGSFFGGYAGATEGAPVDAPPEQAQDFAYYSQEGALGRPAAPAPAEPSDGGVRTHSNRAGQLAEAETFDRDGDRTLMTLTDRTTDDGLALGEPLQAVPSDEKMKEAVLGEHAAELQQQYGRRAEWLAMSLDTPGAQTPVAAAIPADEYAFIVDQAQAAGGRVEAATESPVLLYGFSDDYGTGPAAASQTPRQIALVFPDTETWEAFQWRLKLVPMERVERVRPEEEGLARTSGSRGREQTTSLRRTSEQEIRQRPNVLTAPRVDEEMLGMDLFGERAPESSGASAKRGLVEDGAKARVAAKPLDPEARSELSSRVELRTINLEAYLIEETRDPQSGEVRVVMRLKVIPPAPSDE